MFILLFLGAVVEDVRTIFERKNDATVYIPAFQTQTETRTPVLT